LLKQIDLSSPSGRRAAYADFNLHDHAYLRLAFSNAHWLDERMLRANQPWPHQLKAWRDRGLRTVVNLRGGFQSSFYALEREACERLGLTLVDFTVRSREAPTRDQILGARDLFRSIEYPALMHCKSGIDRAGLMSALYAHFELGHPIEQAARQLGLKYLHLKTGRTGILDELFAHYLREIAPSGISFLKWIESEAYDPAEITREFHATWWGNLLVDRILRRE